MKVCTLDLRSFFVRNFIICRFVVKQNERVQVKFINQIPQGSMHVLPIDTTIKEAERKEVSIRTVVHLHGGFVSAEDDGHPFAWFTKDFNVTGEKYKK